MSDTQHTEREADGLAIGEVRRQPAASRTQLRWYVAFVTLAPFAVMIGALCWMATPGYARRSKDPYFQAIGYGRQLHNAGCQVVIEGDSTAMTGVIPKIIEQRTGLKTCNIAEIAGVQVINGMASLDQFLQNNPRPQFLVFLYVPENLRPPQNWTTVARFEGVYYRERFFPVTSFLKLIVQQPEEVIGYGELGLRTGIQSLLKSAPPDFMQMRIADEGRFRISGETMVDCSTYGLMLNQPDMPWLTHLRQTYSQGGTKVLIDATPEPPCDPSRPFYAKVLTPAVVDNGLATLPVDSYTLGGLLHVNDAGAHLLSEQLANQIAAQIPARRSASGTGGAH